MGPREGVRDRRDGLQLAFAERRPLLRLPRADGSGRDLAPVAPAQEEEHTRHERDEGGDERRPDVPADRLPVDQHDHGVDRRRDRDARKHGRDGHVEHRQSPALAPHRRQELDGDGQVQRGQDEQGRRVEDDRLRCVTHWAIRMIGSRRAAPKGRSTPL